jgi:NADPH2:quinone reductase
MLRRGVYISKPKFPETPGFEAAGIVEEVGADADPALVGRRVAVLAEKCYAEYTTARVKNLLYLPDQLSFEDGAGFPVQSLTAYHMLHTADHVEPGMTLLIHAAAGGVGLQAIQMAKQAGARVFGTTSSAEKAKLAKELGADEVILYNQTDFAARALELTHGRGVDLVLDSVGKATFSGSLKSLAPFGHLISYGFASGLPEQVNVPGLYEKSVKVSGFWLFTLSRMPEAMQSSVREVTQWIVSGKLKMIADLKLPLAEAATAHRKMEARETTGKILLMVR